MLTENDVRTAARSLLADAADLCVLGRMLEGQSNDSWLIAAGGARYVLRSRGRALPPGVDDPAAEVAIWQTAHAAGLAPALVAVDHERGLLLSSYVDSAAAAPSAAELCAMLDAVHRLAVTTRHIDYHAHYAFHCHAAGDGALPAPIREQLDALGAQARPALCHHDPTPGNVLSSDAGVCLIDWEYAAVGWPVFDFAAIVVDWQIPLQRVASLSGFQPDELQCACRLYRQLCAWWQATG